MPYFLDEETQQLVCASITRIFADLQFYTKLAEPKIAKIVSDANSIDIDIRSARKLTERYFDVVEFNKTELGKTILSQLQIVVRCAYVLVLANQPHNQLLLWQTKEELLEAYPQFHGCDQAELTFLLKFRNMMKLALMIVPARLNKKLLINICARLEGSGKEYITGGGQKPCVTRRVEIYEHEGQVHAEKREEPRARRLPGDNSNTRKRPCINTSFKKLKLIRLASDEYRSFARPPVDGNGHLQRGFSSGGYTNSSNNDYDSDQFGTGGAGDLMGIGGGVGSFENLMGAGAGTNWENLLGTAPTLRDDGGVGGAMPPMMPGMEFMHPSMPLSMSMPMPMPGNSSNGFYGQLGTTLSFTNNTNSALNNNISNSSNQLLLPTITDDSSSAALLLGGFAPGFLSREQSEWITQFAREHSDDEMVPNANTEGDGVLIPTLRQLSWEITTDTFAEDLRLVTSIY